MSGDMRQQAIPGRIRARQLGGVPHAHLIALVPFHISEGARHLMADGTGLMLGTLVEDDGIITYVPTPMPKVVGVRLVATVEVTDYSDDEGETTCSLSLRYLTREGVTHALYTQPLVVNGDVVVFEIPMDEVEEQRVLPLALQVSLCSFNEDGSKRPVLIRGAWLGFPE